MCLEMVCAGLCKCAKWNEPLAHCGQSSGVRKSDRVHFVTVGLLSCRDVFLPDVSKVGSFILGAFFFSLVLAKRNLCHRVWRLVSCALMSELPVCLRCRLMWLICCCCDDALVGRSVSGINVQFLVAHHYCQVAGGEPPYVQHTKQKLFHFRSIVLYSERALDCACWCNVLYFLYSKQPSPPLFLFFPSL